MQKQSLVYTFLVLGISLLSCSSSDDLKLCGLGICKPYYYTGLSYQGGLYQVEKDILNNYSPVKGKNNTGVVRVSYKVNCHGDIGDLTYETYDLEFAKTDLHPQLSAQLVNAVSQLSRWNPGMEDGKAINSHGFLAFKINEGIITDILPK